MRSAQEADRFFDSLGCRASDHAFGRVPYAEATELQLEEIFEKGVARAPLSQWEMEAYRTALLQAMAREYARLGWGMELHIGPMRNNNTRMFQALGPDAGFDSCADDAAAHNLSRLLDSLDVEGNLPRSILFALNPKDNYVLSTMLGNFQNSDAPGKIQFGSAWWFNDHIDGMREQLRTLANTGVLGRFVGMVTDSRSFYPTRGMSISAASSAGCLVRWWRRAGTRLTWTRWLGLCGISAMRMRCGILAFR